MKNNTKLIMETWRRFLKEGPEGIDTDGMVLDPDEDIDASDLSPVEDSDLAGDIKKIDQEMDMYGDPAHMGRDSSAPTDGLPGAGDPDYDTTDSTYVSDSREDDPVTFSGSYDDSEIDGPYDPMDDLDDGLDYDSAEAADELSGFDPMDDY